MTSGLCDANTQIRVCAIWKRQSRLHVAEEERGRPKPSLKLQTCCLSPGYVSSDKQLDQDLQICPSCLFFRSLTLLGWTTQA